MKYNYNWTLKDANFTKDKGKVFSCFSCGGGSTMGYKLAGFDVIGMNEIDPKMAECYIENHNPKYAYIEPIQEFKNREDLPEELFNLDILDGSPPCSSFSDAGNREKDWGKEKKFKEGQSLQILDTLFFDFIDLAKRLQPKVIIAENVKGLLKGNAKSYVSKILLEFDNAGYFIDYKLLDSSKMGVPQKRERVFFYAIRKDLYKGEFVDLFGIQPFLDLRFTEKKIYFGEIREGPKIKGSESDIKLANESNGFVKRTSNLKCHNTIAGRTRYLDSKDIKTNEEEFISIGTFPTDYFFPKNQIQYVIGMSVPPVMTAQIADRIYEQWLSTINSEVK